MPHSSQDGRKKARAGEKSVLNTKYEETFSRNQTEYTAPNYRKFDVKRNCTQLNEVRKHIESFLTLCIISSYN